MTELDRGISDLALSLRRGGATIGSLVEASLARIEQARRLNAFVEVDVEGALAEADRLQALLAAGHDLGPLHGLPVAVKDNIAQVGRPNRAGGIVLGESPAEVDSTVVARLRAAGAIVVGRTNMHELAWGGTSDNPHHGRARNPWNPSRVPSGSSGGSGIAVAAGMVVVALGTDTGGSVRLPAATNGVSGLRPTIGRVSNAGVVPLAWTMDTVGPLARDAADVALVHEVLAGRDDRDPATRPGLADHPAVPLDASEVSASVRSLRIGILDGYAFEGCQPDVGARVQDGVDVLQRAGATVRRIAVPGVEQLVNAQIVVDAVEPSAMHIGLLRQHPDRYGVDVRLHLEAGLRFSGVEYVQAQRFRSWFREQLLTAMQEAEVDVLITPTVPFTALPHGALDVQLQGLRESLTAATMRYTAIGSMAGFPGLSVPVGLDRHRLPVGMLVTAPAGREDVALAVGVAFQHLTDHHRLQPDVESALAALS